MASSTASERGLSSSAMYKGTECSGVATCHLLSWKNPTTSSAIFISVNVLYFLVFVLNKSLLAIICYFSLLPFAAGFFFKLLDLAPALGEGDVEVVSHVTVSSAVNGVYERVNASLATLREVLLWKDPVVSMKCCLLMFCTGYVSSFLSVPVLFFCSLWVAFGFTFLKKTCYDSFYRPHVAPQVHMLKQRVKGCFERIPKMKDVTQ